MHKTEIEQSLPPTNRIGHVIRDDHYAKFQSIKSKKLVREADILNSLSDSDTVERVFRPEWGAPYFLTRVPNRYVVADDDQWLVLRTPQNGFENVREIDA
ncbi:hypothetical protein ACH5RR_039374 [Cinchona calisaya]|uniref:Uncharacterized protein n=1 Tax=Cinchona calisaya TaxID=153742 RepID=A0ABD2XZU3_9GENT